MNRRTFLALGPAALSPANAAAPPEPIPEPHFPSRLHQFVWRNWELANLERLASVLAATPAAVLAVGRSLGLPHKRRLSEDQLARLYVTVIRQNWHLLPESQILTLLGWDQDRFKFTLKEDDGLDIKLTPKPHCAELRFEEPTAAQKARAREIRGVVREAFGASLEERGEDLFDFVRQLSATGVPVRAPAAQARPEAGEIDLGRGWAIDAPPELAADARRFRAELEAITGARLASSPSSSTLRLSIAPDRVAGAESFRIEAREREVRILGHDRPGVLQAFHWLTDRFQQREGPFLAPGVVERRAVWNPRYLYSFFALYGDPLLQPERDPFPDGLLEKLARRGINGVWLQAVLNTLAPSARFPEFGQGWQSRLKNLQAMSERAARFGIRVFLYLNEPRAMPPAFFEGRPGIRGSSHRGLNAMCTSAPEVREWIADSLAHVVKHAPSLGGVFCITMSENHTNCFSHGGAWGGNAPNAGDCPRCAKRPSWEAIAELIGTFREGVRRHGSNAGIIAWDWGWGDALAERLIPLLPKDVGFQSISEWDAPVKRGGVEGKVGEYSMSVVGPGPRAEANWRRARAAGLTALAKTQFNNTWEMSAVPYIPVPHLVVEHCERLAAAGIGGIMPSWTCGGYPSPNLAAARPYYFEPRPPREEILAGVARARYGRAAAAAMVEAWRRFSEAFGEFPYGVSIYIVPVQHGPANALRLTPTGRNPGMILFPYDQYKAWSGRYPPAVAQSQFSKLAKLWSEGLAVMVRAMRQVPSGKRPEAELDLAIARTCHHHFQSVANQIEFYLLRDGPPGAESRARMRAIAEEEIALARRQFPLARRHSAIAYEASNHYYYTPLDLVEKVLNCRWVLARLARD